MDVRRVVAATLCLGAAWAPAAFATGPSAFVAGASWTADLDDGRVDVRVLGTTPDGRSVLRLGMHVCSYDLTLTAFSDGASFEAITDNAAPGSTDVTEGSITIDGELRGRDIEGRVVVDVRTYDNAGDTGTCEIDEEYTATSGRRARGYERVAVVAELDADELAAATNAAYAVEGSERIVRVDGDGTRTWEVDSGDTVLALAASDEAVWVVRTGAVERLDALTGESTATLTLPGVEGPTEAAVGDDGALWVANAAAQVVLRISADGASVLTTTEVQGRPSAIVVVGQESIVGVLEPATDAGAATERLERIQPNGEVGAQITVDDVSELAITGDVLWIRGLTGPVEARSLDTLEPLEPRRRVRADGTITAGGALVWVLSGDNLLGYSPEGRRTARIPDLTSADDFTLLAGTELALWVGARGVLLRVS